MAKPAEKKPVENTEESKPEADSRFTDKQLKDFKQVFKLFDKLKQKKIRLFDMKMVLEELGVKPNEKDMNNLIDLFRGEEWLKWDMFLNFIFLYFSLHDIRKELVDAFQVFDPEKTGFVTNDKMIEVLMSKGDKFNEAEMAELIKYGDIDGTGKINYEEFMDRMVAGK